MTGGFPMPDSLTGAERPARDGPARIRYMEWTCAWLALSALAIFWAAALS